MGRSKDVERKMKNARNIRSLKVYSNGGVTHFSKNCCKLSERSQNADISNCLTIRGRKGVQSIPFPHFCSSFTVACVCNSATVQTLCADLVKLVLLLKKYNCFQKNLNHIPWFYQFIFDNMSDYCHRMFYMESLMTGILSYVII